MEAGGKVDMKWEQTQAQHNAEQEERLQHE